MKKYILPIINILVTILCFVVLLFSSLSENVVYLMMMTLLIGWLMPYLVLLITGLEIFAGLKHAKTSLVFNILNILISIMDIYFTIRLFDKKMIVLIVEYIIMIIVSIINVIYLMMYIKKHPNIEKRNESKEIKKIKDKNNGAIV